MPDSITIYGDRHSSRAIDRLLPITLQRMATVNHGPIHEGRPTGAAAIKRAAQKRRNQLRARRTR